MLINILHEVEAILKKDKPIGEWYKYFKVSRYKFEKIMRGELYTRKDRIVYRKVVRKAYDIIVKAQIKIEKAVRSSEND